MNNTPVYNNAVKVVEALKQISGCTVYSIGGSVRDACILQHKLSPATSTIEMTNTIFKDCLAITGKDMDLEVFGATPQQVTEKLDAANIGYDLVGRKFPVYKITGANIDIAFPRRERKTGTTHTDFDFDIDPDMTYAEAALRRDFTTNSIGFNWSTNQLEDPHNGLGDIAKRSLRPISSKFSEDALRVLRAFKFIARLGFRPSIELIERSQDMVDELAAYPYERCVAEWEDFILNGVAGFYEPALRFLIASGVARRMYPEIAAIENVVQHKDHHPEGDVLVHTACCLNYYAANVRAKLSKEDALIVGLAVLTHDLGKAHTTAVDGAKITAIGHEDSPEPRKFLNRLYDPANELINDVEMLVKAHMRPISLYKSNAGPGAFRKLNIAVNGRIDRLAAVIECDQGGRPPKLVKFEYIDWLKDQSMKLGLKTNELVPQLIKGRHIMEHLGMPSGPEYRPILDRMFQEQLDGKFTTTEQGIELLKEYYKASA